MTVTPNCYSVGIDVGKFELFVALWGEETPTAYRSDPDGIAAILKRLAACRAPARVGFESTGGLEYPLWQALTAAGHDARQINPARIKSFARARGTLAKTDAVDATLIAEFVNHFPAAGRIMDTEKLHQIRLLTTKRRQLIEQRKRISNQRCRTRDAMISEMEAAQIALCESQIQRLEKRLQETIANEPALAEKDQLLRSIPGIGPVLSSTFIGSVPELGHIGDKPVSALVGLAPIPRDSGTKQGRRFIQGGRKPVRDTLYAAAISAMRFNPDLRKFAEAKKAEDKPHKQITCAVARKLLITANAILRRRTPWENRTA